MGVSANQLRRTELEGAVRASIRRGKWAAGLWRATADGREILVKDVRTSNPLYRWAFGRLLLWHEAAMYGYVEGCRFVPRFMGWVDSDAFAIEFIPATSLGKLSPPQLTPEFYERLQRCIDELHGLGVVHLDLRSRRNILVTADGEPILIDFGSALFIGRSWLSRRILVPLMGSVDNSAILKFRHRDFPHTLSTAERWRYRFYLIRHVLWPFGKLWRAMGLNHAFKRRGSQTTVAMRATQ